jgi:hypothetical protein
MLKLSCSEKTISGNNAEPLDFLNEFVNDVATLLEHCEKEKTKEETNLADPSPRPSSPFDFSDPGMQASSAAGVLSLVPMPPISPCANGAAERARLQKILDEIFGVRKTIAQEIIAIEKLLRGLERDLKKDCEDILGHAVIDNSQDAQTLAEKEGRFPQPINETPQSQALRKAQQRSTALLERFVQLPQKLKQVFDLTKRLGVEVQSLVPSSLLPKSEARALSVKASEQRHAFHVDLLQKRLETLTTRLSEVQNEAFAGKHSRQNSGTSNTNSKAPTPTGEGSDDDEREQDEMDQQSALVEIQVDMENGIPQEEQLFATRFNAQKMKRKIVDQDDRIKGMEQQMIDQQLSRYSERAQWQALTMALGGGTRPPPAGAPAGWPAWPGMAPGDAAQGSSSKNAKNMPQMPMNPLMFGWHPGMMGAMPPAVPQSSPVQSQQ